MVSRDPKGSAFPQVQKGPDLSQRFGQGNAVDRNRPHIFHRDYWPLRKIRDLLRDFLNQHAAELNGGQALDFGSGEAPYQPWFAASSIQLLLADIDSQSPGVLPITSDGRVPLPDQTLDAVISTQVLEHVADVPAYLREAHRLLKPGKLLFLTTHGAFILHKHPTDMRRWTVQGLQYELEQTGFTDIQISPHIGILAFSTHLRSILYGGLTRRIPFTGWLRPLIYLASNLRMGIEDKLTPASAMDSHPEIILAVARKTK
jgi:SAM-dependent methyltransferase